MKRLFAVALLLLAFAVPAHATPSAGSSSTGGTAVCQDFTITAIATVVAAGNIDLCITFPSTVSSNTAVFNVAAEADAPGTISGTTTFTWTINGATGCTTGTETKTSTSNAATSGGIDWFPVTMTSNQCRGTIHIVVATGTVVTTLITWDLLWNTIVPFSNNDNQDRFCAASANGASCTTPTINNAVTGTLTVTNAGGQTMTVSGTLDVLDRLCAAAATGSSCTVATVNTPLSGSINVANTGTLTVTNAGGQTMTVTGTLDVLDRLCAAAATGSSCTVATVNTPLSGTITSNGAQSISGSLSVTNSGTLTVTNAGGQTMTVSGTLDVLDRLCAAAPTGSTCSVAVVNPCSTATLAADAKACTLNTNTNTTLVGNSTQNVNFPEKLTIGFPGDANHQSVDWFLELIFWAAIIYVCFRFRWWFVFGFAIIGSVHLVVPSWSALTPATFLMFLLLGVIIEFVRYKDKKAVANAVGMA